MTSAAYSFGTYAKALVSSGNNLVITMTGFAFGELPIVEGFLMGTCREQISIEGVAGSAYFRDGFYSRRRSAMVTMTIVARRGRNIIFLKKCYAVYAPGKLFKLVGWNLVRLHCLGVAVAMRTGRRYV